ncbi:bifunctional DNA primase/polymerase [Parahaliea maris]|uniref:Bifunctional DNA primase/polymerase n=1 Tax=Parahaliea maris TaxID=2716870 RepID=A0A5C8ZR27_9GAMM|nr:bifunctional DNA primase/polymerase [Parahaliea maris]TXS90805.1 bifunctional DNA primase/polymerase [Parahaliea maris]
MDPESESYLLSDKIEAAKNQLEKALIYFLAGFLVIPLYPNSKKTTRKWDPWLSHLCEAAIRDYWSRYPSHWIGFIVPEDLVVLDADSPEALAALYQIEESFDLEPGLVVKTRRGEHHYFRLEPGTPVRTQSIDCTKLPQGIDIKARRSMVVLP